MRNQNIKQEIASLIKSRRKLLGITQKDLADIAGVSSRYLYNIEKGVGNPSIETLVAIFNTLGIRMSVGVGRS